MQYTRPKPDSKLTKQERAALLKSYFDFYAELVRRDPNALIRKAPRTAFSELNNKIGGLLLQAAKNLASQDGPVRDFLDQNPLPLALRQHLTDEYRIFCLALNSLKQWNAAEQAATDRFLLGAQVREEAVEVLTKCIVTGSDLTQGDFEFHHPVRDGRPAIPITKEAHARIEGQTKAVASDETGSKLMPVRKKLNCSWKSIHLGCDALTRGEPNTDKRTGAAKSIVRRIMKDTGLTLEQVSGWMKLHKAEK